MSDRKKGRITGQRNIAGKIRGAFLTALNSLETKGTPLDKLIEKNLKEDFNATINALARYNPKEVELTGADGGPIETRELSDIERANRITALIKSGEEG